MKNKKFLAIILATITVTTPIATFATGITNTAEIMVYEDTPGEPELPIPPTSSEEEPEEGIKDNLWVNYDALKGLSPTEKIIEELKALRKKVNVSILSYSDRNELLKAIDNTIKEFQKIIDGVVIEIDIASVKTNTQVVLSKNGIYLKLPKIHDDYRYNYTITRKSDKKEITSGNISYGNIQLPDFYERTQLEINLTVSNINTNKELQSFSFSKEVNDSERPRIEYAYVRDGRLFMKLSDNHKIDSVKYKHEGRSNYVYTNFDFIEVDIPESIEVIITDVFGNENKTSYNISEDNTALTKGVPKSILEELESNRETNVKTFKKYKNVIVVEYGKELHFLDTFKSLLKEELGSYREKDLEIRTNTLSIDKNFIIKLNKEGSFTFNVSEKGKDTIIPIYIIVEGRETGTNIDDIKINNPYVINKKTIRLEDYISFTPKRDIYDINTSFIYGTVKGSDRVFSLKDNITLPKDIICEFEIVDLDKNNSYSFDIVNADKISNNYTSFSDLKGNHWAYGNIIDLSNKGVLSGYPDKTFAPDKNITVREFTTILSRYINTISVSKVVGFQNPISISLTNKDWGYMETKAVFERILENKMKSFNTFDLDRYITREEVAFLVSNVFELPEPTKSTTALSDVIYSKYSSDVQKLNNLGIINGYVDKTFKPTKHISRAETCAILGKLNK